MNRLKAKIKDLKQKTLLVEVENDIRKVEEDISKLLEEEETYWAPRANANWLEKDDKNTRFFHVRATNRKRNNTIMEIMEERGKLVIEEWKIEETIYGYFKTIFSSSQPAAQNMEEVLKSILWKVTDDMNAKLTAPFSEFEVAATIKHLHPTKAPGPDGFPALFYQKYWETVGLSLIKNSLLILDHHSAIRNINEAHIALTQKIKNPQTPAQFRPISFCNVFYKVITKTLANKLKIILDGIFHITKVLLFLAG